MEGSEETLREVRCRLMRKKMGLSINEIQKTSPMDMKISANVSLVKFVRDNFQVKECMRYCEDTFGDNAEICKCGQFRALHEPDFEKNDKLWRADEDIRTRKCDSFGEILFKDENTETKKKSKFLRIAELNSSSIRQEFQAKGLEKIRIDDKFSVKLTQCRLVEFMNIHWKIFEPMPKIAVAILGGSSDFLKPHMLENFFASLNKMANASNALIISEGYNFGLASMVGDKVREGYTLSWEQDDDEMGSSKEQKHKYLLIGFPHWGLVKDRTDLSMKPANQKSTHFFDPPCDNPELLKYVEKPIILRTKRKRIGSEVYLNPDHNHFIMPDDGMRLDGFQKNSRILLKFLNHIGQKQSLINGEKKRNAAYLAKIKSKIEEAQQNGNIDELDKLKIGLKKTEDESAVLKEMYTLPTNIPSICVLISGNHSRIAMVHMCSAESVPLIVCKGTGRAADVIARAVERIEADKFEEGTKTKEQWKKGHVTKIEQDIHALLKEWGNAELSDLALKVYDIAEGGKVTIYDVEGTVEFDLIALKAIESINTDRPPENQVGPAEMLKLAFQWDRSDFAEENIFSRFSKPNEISQTDDGKNVYFEEMMENALIQSKLNFVELLISNGMVNKFLRVKVLRKLYEYALSKDKLLKKIFPKFPRQEDSIVFMKRCYQFIGTIITYENPKGFKSEDELVDEPMRELFIWAIFFNKPNLAEFFWRKLDHPVMTALMGAYILKGLVARISVYEQEHYDFADSKERFEKLATDSITQCSTMDADMTKIILRYKHAEWGQMTLMDVAAQADCRKFLGSHMCQEELSERWHRKIRSRSLILFLGLLFFPAIPFIVNFELDETVNSSYSKKRKRLTEIYRWARVDEGEVETTTTTTTSHVEATSEVQRLKEKIKKKFVLFFNAPKTKFVFTCIFELLYLCLFTYFLLFAYHEQTIEAEKPLEWFLHFWTLTLLIEELRTIVQAPPVKAKAKIQWWFGSVFSKTDGLALILYLTAFIMRVVPSDPEIDYTAKILFAFSLFCFFMHLFNLLNVNSDLGPQILMVGQMLMEVPYFLTMSFLFFLAFGIFHEAVLYDQGVPAIYDNFKAIVEYSWWPFIDGPEIDDLQEAESRQWPCPVPEGNHNCYVEEVSSFVASVAANVSSQQVSNALALTLDSSEPKHVGEMWFLSAWLAFWVLLAFMLVNLLIAIFSNVYEEIKKDANEIWKYYQYQLITEFEAKQIFPPPLSLLHLLWLIPYRLYKLRRRFLRRLAARSLEKDSEESCRAGCHRCFLGCICCRNRVADGNSGKDPSSKEKGGVVEISHAQGHIGNDPVIQFEREAQAAIFRAKRKQDSEMSTSQLADIHSTMRRMTSFIDQLNSVNSEVNRVLKGPDNKSKNNTSNAFKRLSIAIADSNPKLLLEKKKANTSLELSDLKENISTGQVTSVDENVRILSEKFVKIQQRVKQLKDLKVAHLSQQRIANELGHEHPVVAYLPPSGSTGSTLSLPVAGHGLMTVPRPVSPNLFFAVEEEEADDKNEQNS